jgi:hypothetical protein
MVPQQLFHVISLLDMRVRIYVSSFLSYFVVFFFSQLGFPAVVLVLVNLLNHSSELPTHYVYYTFSELEVGTKEGEAKKKYYLPLRLRQDQRDKNIRLAHII